ncbi:catalase-related domain-containing protein [Methanosarcina barkeri]|uniref:catalase-related domain-containing protein n=1 Tax=Methanosarcina barkeri TaxID=2208 RepID=UPI000AE90AD9|nr:catalase-related domain-containing protein [Methanosarcina barkeri]
MTDSTSPDRSINVFNSLKIFKTNDFAQIKERYRSLDKIRQEHMIGNLMADLSHVTIQGAIENLQQADETLAASVAKGVRGYIKIKKRGYFEYRGYPRILYFFIAESPIDCFHFGFWIA